MTTTVSALSSRILREGYGPGAWHGPDMKAAIADVPAAQAFARPATGRHSIAEIALHHAYYVRAVRGQLTGTTPEPFIIDGEDWFELSAEGPLPWEAIQRVVDAQHSTLADVVSRIESGTLASPLPESERVDLVLGITCHAVYHAGQIQLVKRFLSTSGPAKLSRPGYGYLASQPELTVYKHGCCARHPDPGWLTVHAGHTRPGESPSGSIMEL